MGGYFSKSAKNASIAMVCQISMVLMSFVTRTFFIKYLSAEYLGVSGLFSNIITILSFTEMGIGHVMVYSLYEPLKRDDKVKIKSLLSLYKKAYRYIALIILVIGAILTPFIEYLIKGKPDIPEDIRFLFSLYLINTVVSYVATYKKSVLLADQKTYLTNLVATLFQALMIAAQILVLMLYKSFIGFLICQIASTLLINIVLTIIVNRQYKDMLAADTVELPKEDKQKMFANIKALAISKVSGIVSTGTDNIIISKMFGLSPVGLAANYTMLINSVNNVFYNAFTSMSSSIGNFNVDSQIETKRKIFDELFFLVYMVYSFVCVCMMVMIQPFIVTWVGEAYLMPIAIVINLIMGIYVGGMNYPVYSFRTSKGYFKQVQYVYVACAVLNVVLSIILGSFCGVAGVFAATWISKFMLTEVADSLITYRRVLARKPYMYFVKYFVFLVLMFGNAVICYLVVSLVPLQGWLGLIVKGILCALTNLGVNTLLFWHRWEFKSVVRRVMSLVGKVI